MKKRNVLVVFLVFSLSAGGVFAAFGQPFDVPNLSASVTAALGSGTAPLVGVYNTAAANIAGDYTGGLDLVQKIVGKISEHLNPLLGAMKDGSSSTSKDYIYQVYDLFRKVAADLGYIDETIGFPYDPAVTPLKPLVVPLTKKLKTIPVYNGIVDTVNNLIGCLIKGPGDNDNLFGAFNIISQAAFVASYADPPVTSTTVSQYVTPAHVKAFSAAIANVVTAVDQLAKALQKAILELLPPPPPKINPVIGARVPKNDLALYYFNAAADRARLGMIDPPKTPVHLSTGVYDTVGVTVGWSDEYRAKLQTYLGYLAVQMLNTIQKPLDDGIGIIKVRVNVEITKAGVVITWKFSKVYDDIVKNDEKWYTSHDRSSNSSIIKPDCVSRYNATLLAEIASMQRLDKCVELEIGSLGVMATHVVGVINKVKEDAAKTINYLHLCRQSRACAEKVFASFEHQYARAKRTLTLVNDYIAASLAAIDSRATACVAAVAAEIEAKVQTIQDGFDSCVRNGS